MITKVEIENFQSHKKTTVELLPGTNVIIGESDTGKSAIFRAINWVVSNRPLGDSYCSEWGGDTKVTLYTSEGDIIQRLRSTTKNEYNVNGQVIKAFGSEVPEEVTILLQLSPENIQTQIDPPFLLAESPGEAARQLNKAASLDDIDHTITTLKNAYTKISNNIKHNEYELTNYEKNLEKYKDISFIEEKLQQLEQKEQQLLNKVTKLNSISKIICEAEKIENKLRKTNDVDILIERQINIQKQYDNFQSKKQSLGILKQLTIRAEKIQSYLDNTIHVDHALSHIQQIENKYQKLTTTKQNSNTIKNIVNKTTTVTNSINTLDQKIKLLEQEFDKLSPELCPLCGNQIKKER